MKEMRCRWCGKHMGRLPPSLDQCRARLEYGPCVEWKPGMPHWPQYIELDEYVDEQTCEVKLRRKTRNLRLILRHEGQELGQCMVVSVALEADDGDGLVLGLTTQHTDDLYNWIRRLKYPEEFGQKN